MPRHKPLTWMTTALAIGAPAIAQPQTQPATPAKPVPAPAPAAQADKRTFRFQFDGIPYTDVVRLFAQMAGKPLVGDLNVEGTLTFFDSEPFTYNDALDTLNVMLAMRGYQLIENDRYLQLVEFKNIPKLPVRILHGLDAAKDVPRGEIVTVVLTLKFVDAPSVTRALAPMISSFGSVAPLARGKGVVITDRLANIQRIRTILTELDQPTLVDQQVRTYPLKSASARELAGVLNNLFGAVAASKATPREGGDGKVEPPPQLFASFDERTNTLVLIGGGDHLAMAEQMIEKLDTPVAGAAGADAQPGVAQSASLRIFSLKSARAEDLAKTITQALPEKKDAQPARRGGVALPAMPTRIIPDPGTNNLVVSAPADQMGKIEEMIKSLDQATLEVGGARIFKLKAADAQQLASIVIAAVTDRDQRGQPVTKLQVNADGRTNTLIVAGPAGDIQRAEKIIEELDHPPDKEARELHVVQLKAGDASQIAASLTRLFTQGQQQAGRPAASATTLRVEPDVATNSLLISAAPGDWPTIQTILDQLKASAIPMVTPSTRIIPIKNAKAVEVAQSLREIYATHGRTGRPSDRNTVPVTISASDRANSILVSAADDDQQTIAELIKSIDIPADEVKVEPVQVIRLKSADANRLAETLRAMIPSVSKGKPQEIAVQADPLTNSVILRAPDAQRVMMEEMIAKLDQATLEEARETRIIPLKHTSASTLAPMLAQVFASNAPPRPGGSKPTDVDQRVFITAAPGDKALIIDAPRQRLAQASQLIQSLDVDQAPGQVQVRTYQITNSRATDLAPTLARLFLAQQRPGVQPSTEPQPRFEADASTNQLLISATASQFGEIEPILKKLESASALASQTRTFVLKAARAPDMAGVLQAMLTDQPVAGQPKRNAQGAVEMPTRVAALADSNAVVVQGTPEKLALAEQLIAGLDKAEVAGTGAITVQIVQLTNGQAATMAQSVNAALADPTPPRPGQNIAAERVTVTAESNSNSLLVRGPTERVAGVIEMIKRLDAAGVAAMQTKTFALKSARAADVAGVLASMLVESAPSGGARRNAQGAVEQAAKVAAVAETNSVVVQGSAEKLALADQIIKSLDTAQAAAAAAGVQVVYLKNAQAQSLAQSVAAALADTGPARPGQNTAAERITVTPESNSNSLLIRGPGDRLNAVVEMIKELDERSAPNAVGGTQVRVYPLENGQAADLAKSLGPLFQDLLRQQVSRDPVRSREPIPFTITADPRTNSLVVSTTPANFNTFEQLLKNLDQASRRATADLTMFPLRNANASDVAAKLKAMFLDRKGADKPVIDADTISNSVTVIAAEADLKIIQPIVAKFDDAARDDSVHVRVIPLTQSNAEQMAMMLRTVYPQMTGSKVNLADKISDDARRPQEKPGQRVSPSLLTQSIFTISIGAQTADAKPGAGKGPEVKGVGVGAGGGDDVSIAVDKSSNALIVSGKRQDIDNIETLIAQLMSSTARPDAEFRAFKIAKGDPESIAQTLDELYNPKLPKLVPGQDPRTIPPPPPPVISVVADAATRSVIIRAKPTDFTVLEMLIEHLDQAAEVVSELRVFPLKNTEASEVATNLKDLFALAVAPAPNAPAPPPAANAQGNRAMRLRQAIAAAAAQPGKSTKGDLAKAVAVSANKTSNSVVVSAPSEVMELVTHIVQELDQSAAEATTPVVRMYPLKNADVRPVVTALQELFTAPQRAAGAGGAKETPVVVTGDDAGRQILVSAAAPKHELIAKVVTQIDQAQQGGQVAVKVYSIQHADAGTVAAALTSTLTSDGGRPGASRGAASPALRIASDASSNSLVVRASTEEHERIAGLLKELDAAPAQAMPVQSIALKNADPSAVVPTLNRVFGPQPGVRPTPGRPQVVIEADRGSRAVLVRADAATFDKIKQLVTQLDAATPGGETTPTVIQLKRAQASSVAAALGPAFAAPRGKPVAPEELVTIIAEPMTNSLVVTASQQNLPRVQALVDKLDAENADGARTELIVLKNARATDLVGTLQRVASASGPAKPGQGPGVVVSADAGSNTIVMSGPAVEINKLIAMANQLDQASVAAAPSVFILPLKNGEAATTAGLVRDLYNQQAQALARSQKTIDPLAVSADDRSNALVLATSKAMYEQVSAWVKQLEGMEASPAQGVGVQVIALKNADANTVAQTLNRVFVAGQSGRAAAAKPAIVIEPNQAARTILVRSDAPTFEKIKELAANLDNATAGAEMTPVVIQLKRAQANFVAQAVSPAFVPRGKTPLPEDFVSIVPEPMSNTVVVTASAANLPKVQALIDKLDAENADGVKTDMVALKNARASELAAVLQRVAGAGGPPKPGMPQGVVVSPDNASNSLVVSGPAADVARITTMAGQLDQASSGATPSVYILPLKNGEAVTVAAMVRDLYNQQAQAAARLQKSIDPMAVSADDRANAIVVATTKPMYEQVSQWVTKVEEMKPARGTLRVISLQNADPGEVDKAIRELFGVKPGAGPGGQRGGGRPGAAAPSGGGAIETTLMPQQRSILVSASDEDFQAITKLVEALDATAAKAKHQTKVFTLKRANNQRVAEAITGLYRPLPGKPASPEDAVTVTPLAQTDSLVVSATPGRLEDIGHLVEELDKQDIAQQVEFRIYPLKNTTPTKVLPTLQQMLQPLRQARPTDPLNVQADERTRSVIVAARGAAFEQVETMLKTLDQAPAHVAGEVLIVPLKKADATRLAALLTEMLQPSPAGQVTPEARALQEQVRVLRVRRGAGEPAADTELPELDLTKPIKVSADPGAQGSNSLVITSTPDNLRAMKAVIEILDVVPVADGVRVRVVHLKNADAQSAASIVNQIFTQGKQLAVKPGSGASGRAEPDSTAGKGLVNTLSVAADARTNSLVISGVDESVALADLILKDLDRAEGKLVTEVKLFRLKHAEAARVLPMLQAAFNEGPPAPGFEGLRTQVSRLQNSNGGKESTEVGRIRPAFTVQADPVSQVLIVAARSDMMPLIEDVVKTMDVPGAAAANSVRIIPLVNADAARLKQVIDGLYQGPAASQVRPEDRPTITVDSRTNALVITASDKAFNVLDSMMKQLDAKAPIDLAGVKLLPLKNAEAAALSRVLQQMLDARLQRLAQAGGREADAARVVVMADPRSNSLMVSGSAEGFELVKQLATQLDNANPAINAEVQIIALKKANAGTLSTTLQRLFEQRYQAAAAAGGGGAPGSLGQRPLIVPDLRTNSLMVAVGPDDNRVLQGLLKQLDVDLASPSVRLEVIALKHNDSAAIAPMVQNMFAARVRSMTPPGTPEQPQDRVDVTFDQLTNALIVSASAENLGLIKGLLEKVDVQPPSETGVVRMFPLKNADAQRVATMLQGLISQGLYKPGAPAAAGNAAVQQREKVAITTDVRTNVVVVSASKENFAVIEEIIRNIDASTDLANGGDIKVYTLSRADAARLAPTLQNFFNAKRAGEVTAGGTGRSLPVTIIPDSRTNSLMVAGSRESFAAIDALVQKLDGNQALPLNEFRVFYLKNASATAIQPTLQQLFDQRAAKDDNTRKNAVTVVSDPRTNSLVIGASADDLELGEAIVKRLDIEPEQPGNKVAVFPLVKADALSVANTLRSIFSTPTQPTAGTQGSPTSGQTNSTWQNPAVTISADVRLNAIVASAQQADIDRISELVRQLDGDLQLKVTEIKVFPLSTADATELASVLTNAIKGGSKPAVGGGAGAAQGGNAGAIAQQIQFVQRSPDGQALVSSTLQEGVLITPDKRTNAVVVSAPVENMDLIGSLIRAMDSPSPQKAQIRVFRLQNADARQMADVLSTLFKLQGGGGANARAFSYTLVSVPATQPSGSQASAATQPSSEPVTLGTAEQAALSVTVDSRTNTLLVSGTKHHIDLVSDVIRELDSSPAQERMTQLYRPRNTQAKDLQTALRGFLDQERQRVVAALGNDKLGAAQRLLDREVAVVAEDTTNTLLLSASPRYFETISKLVKELDQPQPQVLIQVLLAEVRLDDNQDLGFEWQFTKGFGEYTGRTGTNFSSPNTPSFVNQANPALPALPAGLSMAVTGGDMKFVLRALQTKAKLEVLSRPQILAYDNQEASIQVGQSVPLVDTSRVSGDTANPVVFNTIKYRDVGVGLKVKPRINPDGFVKLEVEPKIENLAQSTIDVGGGTKAVVINQRVAKTTVTVQDGHTIIIGGLITHTEDSSDSRVPVLGDIPLVGNLFKSTSVKKGKSELLIILTPHVMSNVSGSDKLTVDQMKRLDLLRGLNRGETKDEQIRRIGVGRDDEKTPATSPDDDATELNSEMGTKKPTDKKSHDAPQNVPKPRDSGSMLEE